MTAAAGRLITSTTGVEVAAGCVPSPAYEAVMECEPTDSVVVASVATPELKATVPNGVLPSLKVTLPVAPVAAVAVNVTLAPADAGFESEVRVIEEVIGVKGAAATMPRHPVVNQTTGSDARNKMTARGDFFRENLGPMDYSQIILSL